MPRKQPITYTDELGQELAELVADGGLIKRICRENPDRFPSAKAVFNWAANKEHPFHELYIKANTARAMGWIEECIDIADDATVDTEYTISGIAKPNNEWINRSKLRVETRLKIFDSLVRLNQLSNLEGAPTTEAQKVEVIFKQASS